MAAAAELLIKPATEPGPVLAADETSREQGTNGAGFVESHRLATSTEPGSSGRNRRFRHSQIRGVKDTNLKEAPGAGQR